MTNYFFFKLNLAQRVYFLIFHLYNFIIITQEQISEQREQKTFKMQNSPKAFKIFIPQKQCISSKNEQKSSHIQLDKRIKQYFKQCFDQSSKRQNIKTSEPSVSFNNLKSGPDKIFNPKILQNLVSTSKKKQTNVKQNKKQVINYEIKMFNKQKADLKSYFQTSNAAQQISTIQNVLDKNKAQTYRTNIKMKFPQQEQIYIQNRSKTLQNYQKLQRNDFNAQEIDVQIDQNAIASLDFQQQSYHTNNNIMNKFKMKKSKKKMPNSSYMFLNNRHKFNSDPIQKYIKKIQMPQPSKGTMRPNEMRKHLVLKSNSNNKLIRRNKSYSKDNQIFSFLNLTPQHNNRNDQQSAKFFQIQRSIKHSDFNSFSHKRLRTSQFSTRKQKSTNKLHSYRRQKLQILAQDKKKAQINNYHNKKILEQLKNPLSSLGELVNQILSLPNDNKVQIPRELGINKVKLAGHQTKTVFNVKKTSEKQKQKKLEKKIRKKPKFNQICNVEPWQQITQNNFYQTSKFLFSQTKNSIF